MSCVHYKFSSKLQYDTVTFDGLNIMLSDLKRQIMGRERLRAADCDLQITNAQTKEEYTDDAALIPKNSSVIIRRIPLGGVKATSKSYNNQQYYIDHSDHRSDSAGLSKAIDDQHGGSRSLAQLSKTANLAEADASEEDKIKAMMSQSNHEYDPIHYMKKLTGPPPPNYTCYRCGKNGHYIRNCPTNGQDKTFEAPQRMKKSTGIPRSFMTEVNDPTMKGAMITNTGRYAIPTIDAEAYAIGKKEKPPFLPRDASSSEEDVDPVPDELQCLFCKDLMTDAVVIPCCGNSYCDDCIRTSLLESEEHVCPNCSQSDVSPDALIANKFLRQAVNNFKNETGYTRRMKGASQTSTDPSSTPAPPTPAPPPQSRPPRPYQTTRSQQDPLMPRPPAADTPPLAQQQLADTPPTVGNVTTGSSHSTPVPSPQHLANLEEPLITKDPESVIPSLPSQPAPLPADPCLPMPLIPKGYPVSLLGQPLSLNHPLRHTGPPPRHNPPRHSGGHPNWDGPPIRGRAHNDRPPRSHPPPSQPPHPSGPPPLFNPPSLFSSPQPPVVGPPPFPPLGYPPGQPPPTSYPVPPPGYPPASAGVPTPPWAPPNTQPPPPQRPHPSPLLRPPSSPRTSSTDNRGG